MKIAFDYTILSKERWFFPIPLCVKSKFNQSYKDIDDDKFDVVVQHIDFLKKIQVNFYKKQTLSKIIYKPTKK